MAFSPNPLKSVLIGTCSLLKRKGVIHLKRSSARCCRWPVEEHATSRDELQQTTEISEVGTEDGEPEFLGLQEKSAVLQRTKAFRASVCLASKQDNREQRRRS